MTILLWVVTISAGLVLAYALLIRPWIIGWGATAPEIARALPGDDLVPEAKMTLTHALTINVAPEEVWPWLVQIGHKRAGWYSHDWIHRVMGIAGSVDDAQSSASRIIPELQNLEVGDDIGLAPGMAYKVAEIEPNRSLVLHIAVDTSDFHSLAPSDPMPEKYLCSSWGWFLDRGGEGGGTRLIVRIKQDYDPGLVNRIMMRCLIEPGSFFMQYRTMLNIKRRAEGSVD